MIFNKLLYWPSEGRNNLLSWCLGVFSVSWSMNLSVFPAHRSLSRIIFPARWRATSSSSVVVAGVKWPLSDSWRFCNVHGASVETITYSWCIGAQLVAHSSQLALRILFYKIRGPFMINTHKKWSYCSKKYLKKCIENEKLSSMQHLSMSEKCE